MSACYLCGSTNSHTFDCPKIQTQHIKPEATIVTFTKTASDWDGIWYIDKVKIGDRIPKWATHGWYLVNDSTCSSSSIPIKKLADIWAARRGSPWELSLYAVVPGEIYGTPETSWELALFGLVK